jgi:threonine synthase
MAPIALTAGEIDFADHAPSDPLGRICVHHFSDKFVAGRPAKAVIAPLELEIGIADAAVNQPDGSESFRTPGRRLLAHGYSAILKTHGEHIVDTLIMLAELACFEHDCGVRLEITEAIYNCPKCAGLLEVRLTGEADAARWKKIWRERRMCSQPLDQSGVWRYRELLPFDGQESAVVSLREGNTPLLDAPRAAEYGGLDRVTFKHQGFNPTGSFKDNGMTCGVTQAIRLGRARVACVSTGNTSASMAAYASAAGLDPIVFIPHGNISYGKLAQALEYGARTLQVEANFDQILALVRALAERLGIYLLNSINPFRIEGQKTIVIEMLDQRDWNPPDWIVLPGGNLGNASAFGKALRELRDFGFIGKMPRLAVIQAEGAAPFYEFFRRRDEFRSVSDPKTLATAIQIGDPVSWPKALHELTSTDGVVEKVSEQEIADAKAIIGRCGIGCEPASAATLAGIRKLIEARVIRSGEDVVAVLTGNVLKDPDYIYRYHTGQLQDPEGKQLKSRFGNNPLVAPNDADAIAKMLEGGPTV